MSTITYPELLVEALPSAIETAEEYERLHKRLVGLVGKGRKRSGDETKLMHLLMVLVEDFDRRHPFPADASTPSERLRYLLEASGREQRDLVPVFGQRSHVNEALHGKRPISATQARKLGTMFHLNPGYFL